MERLAVLKTYKMYIGGKFPRTESGRFYTPEGLSVNMCLASRKDFRNAVVAARSAQGGWASRSAYNRSQILYRIAEMLETRTAQFVEELEQQGLSKKQAQLEVEQAVDLWVYYAGWCDKYQQIFSAVNPVASSHFNFSVLEPMGMVTSFCAAATSLLGISGAIASAIAGGNTIIAIASEKLPLCAITLAEVINDSDVPGGVVNILTGQSSELLEHISGHKDVNAVVYNGNDADVIKSLEAKSIVNLKRIIIQSHSSVDDWESPYRIKELNEVKTTWHPIENIGGAKSSY